jgi:hypothetical protein
VVTVIKENNEDVEDKSAEIGQEANAKHNEEADKSNDVEEEEEERLAEDIKDDKEKTKELCLRNDGTYDGKCEFKDDDGTAEQDQVDFEHSVADRGLWEEYDRNYNGADWEYDKADA